MRFSVHCPRGSLKPEGLGDGLKHNSFLPPALLLLMNRIRIRARELQKFPTQIVTQPRPAFIAEKPDFASQTAAQTSSWTLRFGHLDIRILDLFRILVLSGAEGSCFVFRISFGPCQFVIATSSRSLA